MIDSAPNSKSNQRCVRSAYTVHGIDYLVLESAKTQSAAGAEQPH